MNDERYIDQYGHEWEEYGFECPRCKQDLSQVIDINADERPTITCPSCLHTWPFGNEEEEEEEDT